MCAGGVRIGLKYGLTCWTRGFSFFAGAGGTEALRARLAAGSSSSGWLAPLTRTLGAPRARLAGGDGLFSGDAGRFVVFVVARPRVVVFAFSALAAAGFVTGLALGADFFAVAFVAGLASGLVDAERVDRLGGMMNNTGGLRR